MSDPLSSVLLNVLRPQVGLGGGGGGSRAQTSQFPRSKAQHPTQHCRTSHRQSTATVLSLADRITPRGGGGGLCSPLQPPLWMPPGQSAYGAGGLWEGGWGGGG